MKFVTKEYFACKCIEQISSCRYLYRQQIKGVICAVKHKFQITVNHMTDNELEWYVTNEINQIFQ